MSQNLRKLYQLYDEATELWLDKYLVRGVGNKTIQVEVPREIREPVQLRRRLLSKGAALPSLDECRLELAAEAEADAPVMVRAGRTGWREDGATFVGHAYVRGPDAGTLILPSRKTLRLAADLNVQGSLKGWQGVVVKLASSSTAMIVSIGAAFAGYLLKLLGRSGFAIVLVGRSRSGKSTAQLVAGSVIGFGREEHLPSLNATPAGLMEAGLVFNDMVLPLNEIGTARGARGDVHRSVRDATYQLTGGRDVMRHNTWDGHNFASNSFVTLPLFSSELSPDEWAARGGETRDPGETARLIAYPVAVDGHETVFDLYSPEEGGIPTHEWAAQQFETLRQGLPVQHGTAGLAFIERLLLDKEPILRNAREDIRLFEKEMQESTTTPIERDIVSKFGVLYAGCSAAAEAGIFPIELNSIWDAHVRACKSALGALPNGDANFQEDLLRLRALLDSGSVVVADNLSPANQRTLHQADGFSRGESIGRLFVVRSDRLAILFRSPNRARRVYEWLDDQGNLRHQKERKTLASNEWAQRQITWPDGSRHRSICMFFPNGLDALDLRR